jgi:Tfp pilus assembly protein PilF
MRHYPALHRATLTISIMLVAISGAAFAEPFEDAPRDLRPLVPFPPPATRSGAVGGLPSSVATGSVPTNIPVAQVAQAPTAGIEASDREDCADDTENSDQKIASCSRVIADNTANAAKRAQAYRSRGAAYYDKSDYDRVIADFSEAMKLDPNIVPPSFAHAYNRRGLAYVEKKDYDLAIADYGEAIKLDSSSAEVYNNRGTAYNIKEEYDRAIPDFDQALTLDSNYALAYNNRGFAYFRKNDTDRAIADYSEALKHNANYAIAYNTAATLTSKGTTTTVRSPTIARPSGAIRTIRSFTITEVSHIPERMISTARLLTTTRRSGSIRGWPGPTAIAATRTTR